MNLHFNKRGFTLIELAIVLVIIGLVLTLGASLIGPLTQRVKLNETRDTINADVESVIGYAAANQKIPDSITAFQSLIKCPKDAWGRSFYYFFEPSITTSGSICGRKTTNLTICKDATCTSTIPNVAFVIISGADNYNPQTGIITAGCPSGQTCIGIYDTGTPNIDDCTTTTNCPDTNYPSVEDRINRQEAYDDITRWVTLDELRTKIGCQGGQLRILNNEFPSGSTSAPYSATTYAEGGVPFATGGNYRWCLQTATGNLAIDLPGFTVTPNVVNTNCQGLSEGSWGQANTLQFSKPASTGIAGSYKFSIFVRDNNDVTGTNDNITQKSFVLTINP